MAHSEPEVIDKRTDRSRSFSALPVGTFFVYRNKLYRKESAYIAQATRTRREVLFSGSGDLVVPVKVEIIITETIEL